MTSALLDVETWLDVTVNLVPLAVIGVFLALFTAWSPWGRSGLASALALGVLVVSITLLALATAATAKVL